MKHFIALVIVMISSAFLGAAKPMKSQAEIYFAGGCFWGAEHFLKRIRGIENIQVGYTNSNIANPSYEQICSRKTNTAEVIKVVYDPRTVDLNLLLDLYFETVDPISLNRQGNDRGARYRTEIYYVDKEDLPTIKQVIRLLSAQYRTLIVPEVKPLINFYPVETYYQDYLDKNPGGYCHINLALFEMAHKANAPKVRAYRKADSAILHKELSAEQYAVTQKNVTRPAFHNKYQNEHCPGICMGITTEEPLFVSVDKFNLGCGWPSFSQPIQKDLIAEKKDTSHGMIHAEVRSKTGDAHLGHVFTDGPGEKSGLRYCVNSASLCLIPKDKMKEEDYGEYLPFVKQILKSYRS